jgi:hypothetical protein
MKCSLSILDVGCILVLAALAKNLLAQLPYSLATSFADLGRAFSGADSDVLGSASCTFAEIGGGVARVAFESMRYSDTNLCCRIFTLYKT